MSGPGGVGGLKRIRNMQSSKCGLNASSATFVNKKSSTFDSSPSASTLQAHSQHRLNVSLGQNMTSNARQSTLGHDLGLTWTKTKETGGIKLVRLMRSRKDSLNSSVAKSPSLGSQACPDGVESLGAPCGSGQDIGSSRTSPTRVQMHDVFGTSHFQNNDTSADK